MGRSLWTSERPYTYFRMVWNGLGPINRPNVNVYSTHDYICSLMCSNYYGCHRAEQMLFMPWYVSCVSLLWLYLTLLSIVWAKLSSFIGFEARKGGFWKTELARDKVNILLNLDLAKVFQKMDLFATCYMFKGEVYVRWRVHMRMPRLYYILGRCHVIYALWENFHFICFTWFTCFMTLFFSFIC